MNSTVATPRQLAEVITTPDPDTPILDALVAELGPPRVAALITDSATAAEPSEPAEPKPTAPHPETTSPAEPTSDPHSPSPGSEIPAPPAEHDDEHRSDDEPDGETAP
jgi:hypothetical protein